MLDIRVAKRVGVYVRQAVTLAEFCEPVCNAVRVHGSAVILLKYKTLSAVILAETQYLAALPCPVLPQKLHRLDRQRNITLRPLGFGRVLIDAAIGRILDIVADAYFIYEHCTHLHIQDKLSPKVTVNRFFQKMS